MLYSPYTLYRDTCCTAHTRILYIVGHMLMGCVGHVRYLRLWDTCAGLLGLDQVGLVSIQGKLVELVRVHEAGTHEACGLHSYGLHVYGLRVVGGLMGYM
jgi:hypothetical protein